MEELKADEWLRSDSILGLKDLIETDPEKYADLHPIDMIKMMDEVTSSIIKATTNRGKLTRVKWQIQWEKIFLEFGQWSHVFNKILRMQIKNTKDDTEEIIMDLHMKYCYAYSYWWNRYHYITSILSSKSRLSGKSVNAGLKRGQDTLRRLIKGEVDFTQLHDDFKKLIASHQMASYSEALTKPKGEK